MIVQGMSAFRARAQENAGLPTTQVNFELFRKLGSPHATQSKDKLDEFRTPLTEKCVAELYQSDLEAFGYASI